MADDEPLLINNQNPDEDPNNAGEFNSSVTHPRTRSSSASSDASQPSFDSDLSLWQLEFVDDALSISSSLEGNASDAGESPVSVLDPRSSSSSSSSDASSQRLSASSETELSTQLGQLDFTGIKGYNEILSRWLHEGFNEGASDQAVPPLGATTITVVMPGKILNEYYRIGWLIGIKSEGNKPKDSYVRGMVRAAGKFSGRWMKSLNSDLTVTMLPNNYVTLRYSWLMAGFYAGCYWFLREQE